MAATTTPHPHSRRVLLLGATGTIGRATARVLRSRGHEVVCLVRRAADAAAASNDTFEGMELRLGDATDAASLTRAGFRGESFDAVVSCMASRTGAPRDAWAVDYAAHVNALKAAKQAGVRHFVLLSAICVQKPRLAFQHAKLAFERELIASGLDYSIVRPTAFYKSLCGQVARVTSGKAYLLFGDGRRTACKPISDNDLAMYLATCLEDPHLRNRILPIGGPGPAITPREQGEFLFALLGRQPQFAQVPIAAIDLTVHTLTALSLLLPFLKVKAELARIARYYATESMLVLDADTGGYDAEGTPSTGSETLYGFLKQLVAGSATVERGAHKVL